LDGIHGPGGGNSPEIKQGFELKICVRWTWIRIMRWRIRVIRWRCRGWGCWLPQGLLEGFLRSIGILGAHGWFGNQCHGYCIQFYCRMFMIHRETIACGKRQDLKRSFVLRGCIHVEIWIYRIIGALTFVVFSVMALGVIRYLIYLLAGSIFLVDMGLKGLVQGLRWLYDFIRRKKGLHWGAIPFIIRLGGFWLPIIYQG
jgi:hypothetical protein